MKFSIAHSTTYTYALPVQLAPHVVRLRPRCDGALWLSHFDIRIEPHPSALSQCLDLEGNTVTHAWFDGKTERLSVTSRSEVETLRTNAFDYLLDPSAWRLPPPYTGVLETLLAPYCLRAESEDIGKFAQDIANEAGGSTLDFLDRLSRRIHETCSHIIRETGRPQASEFTLQQRRGSCRDLAVLFIDACRAVGLAAPFRQRLSALRQGSSETLHARLAGGISSRGRMARLRPNTWWPGRRSSRGRSCIP